MAGAILVNAYLVDVRVRAQQRSNEGLLEVHRVSEALVVGADVRLESDHVEVQTFARDDSLEERGEFVGTPSQEDAKGVLLRHGQLDQFHDFLVPPASPGALLLLFYTITGRGEDFRIVPPAAVDEYVRAA